MIELDNKSRPVFAPIKFFGKYAIQQLVYVRNEPNGAMFRYPHKKACAFFIPIAQIRKDFFETGQEAKGRMAEIMKDLMKKCAQGINDELSLVPTVELKRVMTTLPVVECDRAGTRLKVYPNIIDAAKKNRISAWLILNAAEGTIPTAKNRRWKYVCEL